MGHVYTYSQVVTPVLSTTYVFTLFPASAGEFRLREVTCSVDNVTDDDVGVLTVVVRRISSSGTGTSGTAVAFAPDAPASKMTPRHTFTVTPNIVAAIQVLYMDTRWSGVASIDFNDWSSPRILGNGGGWSVGVNAYFNSSFNARFSATWEE